jgi:hypothetical protein
MFCASAIGADGSVAAIIARPNASSLSLTVLATSAPGIIAAGAWYYVETKIKVNNTTGVLDVKVNGTTVCSFSGDTCQSVGSGTVGGAAFTASTNEHFTHIKLGGLAVYNTSATVYFDDWYYCDDTGAQNNTYLGDVQLQAIYPDAPGSQTDWSIGGTAPAATNWQSVDETSPDDDVTYVNSDTVGDQDLYEMQDISATASSVVGLLCNARMKKDDATVREYALLVESGGTVAQLATRTTPYGAYTNQQDVSELNPDTGSLWTVAEVNAMTAGIEVIS